MEAMASKGEKKLTAKLDNMKKSYSAASSRAQSNFAAVGFGPTRTANYRSAWTYMPGNYDTGMTADKIAKWRTNWLASLLRSILTGLRDERVNLSISQFL
jgi:hypothetical protein